MRNIIKNLPENEFINLIKSSSSVNDVVRKLKLNPCGAHYASIKARCAELNLDKSHFIKNYHGLIKSSDKKRIPLKSILIENSSYQNIGCLKVRLVKEGFLTYQCKCGNKGEWNNQSLSLQLEHKNGIRNDHRITNLEFLCPNCHSQTETYAGKNKHKI